MKRFLVVIGMLICLAGALPARQDLEPEALVPIENPRPAFADDNHAVRFILKHLVKATPLQSFQELDAHDSVLIVLGSTKFLDDDLVTQEKFRGFVERGGSVLIATDQTTADAVSHALHVRVIGDQPVLAQDPAESYRGQPACPVIREFNQSYSIFKNVETIATNHAGRVEATRRSNAIAMAPFPASCRGQNEKAIPNFAMLTEREPSPLQSYNGGGMRKPPAGQRILVLSAHRVFINGMMLQKDNDNIVFALNSIRWVCDAEDGAARRSKVLLIQDGQIETSFDVKVKAVPGTLPTDFPKDLPGHPVDLINGLLAKWEDENVHNEILLGHSSWRQILSGAAIALSIVLIIYGLYRVQMAHHRVETGP